MPEDATLNRHTDADRLSRFDFVFPSAHPSKAVRDSVFRSLLDPENRITEPWVLQSLRLLNHPLRQEEALGYIVPGLDVDVYEDTAAAAKWLIDNYAVDHERMYWVGQSAGSVACWAIISSHPELCTGYFGTNGGVSAAYDLSPEGITDEAREETWKVLKVFVENRIPICFTCGEEDANSANHYAAEVYYPMLHDAYVAEGLSEREIYDLVKIYVMPHSTYSIAPDLTDHNVVRMMNWLIPARIFEMSTVLGW